jgi:hypothetical protein
MRRSTPVSSSRPARRPRAVLGRRPRRRREVAGYRSRYVGEGRSRPREARRGRCARTRQARSAAAEQTRRVQEGPSASTGPARRSAPVRAPPVPARPPALQQRPARLCRRRRSKSLHAVDPERGRLQSQAAQVLRAGAEPAPARVPGRAPPPTRPRPEAARGSPGRRSRSRRRSRVPRGRRMARATPPRQTRPLCRPGNLRRRPSPCERRSSPDGEASRCSRLRFGSRRCCRRAGPCPRTRPFPQRVPQRRPRRLPRCRDPGAGRPRTGRLRVRTAAARGRRPAMSRPGQTKGGSRRRRLTAGRFGACVGSLFAIRTTSEANGSVVVGCCQQWLRTIVERHYTSASNEPP